MPFREESQESHTLYFVIKIIFEEASMTANVVYLNRTMGKLNYF